MAGPRQSQASIDQWRPEDLNSFTEESAEYLREKCSERKLNHRKDREKTSTVRQKDFDGSFTLSKHCRRRSRSRERTHKDRSKARSVHRSRSGSRNTSWQDDRESVHRHYRSSRSKVEDISENHLSHRHNYTSIKRQRSRSVSPTREDTKRSRYRGSHSRSLEQSSSHSKLIEISRKSSERRPTYDVSRTEREHKGHYPANHKSTLHRRQSRSRDPSDPARSRGHHRKHSSSPSRDFTARRERVKRHSPYGGSCSEVYATVDSRLHKDDRVEECRFGGQRKRYEVRSRSPRHRISAPDHYKEVISERQAKHRGRRYTENQDHQDRDYSPNFRSAFLTEKGERTRDPLDHSYQNSGDTGREKRRRNRDQEDYVDDRKMRGGSRPSRPYVDTRYSHSPSYVPMNQHSPHSQSPYSGRGGWSGANYGSHQGSPTHGYSPGQSPYHQGYQPCSSAQSPYYPNQPYVGHPQQVQQGYQNQGYRPSHNNYRGNHFNGADRRTSGPPLQPFSPAQGQRSRTGSGHFSNLSWTPATGSRGGRPPSDKSRSASATPSATGIQAEVPNNAGQVIGFTEEEDNPFRPSKDLRVEDQTEIEEKTMPPPPSKANVSNSESQAGSKISFALKSRAPPPAAATTNVDLTQRGKEPLIPAKVKPVAKSASITLSNKGKYDSRYDRRSDHGMDRRSDHRYSDQRMDKRHNTWFEKRNEKPRLEKKIVRRPKPRPKLPADLTSSESVYYRKPGNESVVGSGTYGKVFRAVHVYTKNMVALKKIRMEGERDGV